jgi:hypothetical protein
VQQDPSAVEYDGPTLSEQSPAGERMIVHQHLSAREETRGWVAGYTEALVDLGRLESGPRPRGECDLIVAPCDDGKIREGLSRQP